MDAADAVRNLRRNIINMDIYGKDPIFLEGYQVGELERQFLARQNSDFRSELSFLTKELNELYLLADELYETLDHNANDHDNYTWCTKRHNVLQKYKKYKDR